MFEEAPDLEWSRQPGMVNALLVGLLLILDKGCLLTLQLEPCSGPPGLGAVL